MVLFILITDYIGYLRSFFFLKDTVIYVTRNVKSLKKSSYIIYLCILIHAKELCY